MSATPAVKYKPVSDDGFEDVKTDDDHEEYPLHQENWNSSRGTSKSRRAIQILVSLLILAIYTWAVLYYAREVIYKPFCPRLTTPDTVHVWDKVEFNPQPVNPVTPGHDHPLLGNPSPEVDANWSSLLSAFANRIPKSEVHRLGMETDAIPFNDGEGGYLGGLAMVHNLHCINYLYQVAHREYYYTPNTTEKEDATQKSHIGHCLHHIMESVKCQADLTPVLLHWTLHDFHSVINWDGVERTCADWSQLMDWGSEHSVRKSSSISQFTGNFLDEHGKFGWVDQEGGVDYKEFFKTPEYQKWAKEQGLALGEAAAEEYLRSFYVKH
ncbi:Tat pathway signal sequence [Colletotrichum scovillei]|uniref:Tat pathway signal sequence n=1 Tax=Colletotrichum scovillei TaxID=1209932 RepID=A0A9P7UIQ5_9PEZI|nr:Tat pathway signal sequence [Colletotrichum scovillei]KAG7069852.1 Tat pathway signal sequence [Colletotrichum scovillei]KAG7073798.1 Tat pathway signal sequence [Colletotrichum scovillei]